MTNNLPIHSIYLTHDQKNNSQLPKRIASNTHSFQTCYPTSRHTIYNIHKARDFINIYFSKDVLRAFDELIPLAYKADLLRYCLLYQEGGVYADLSIHFFYPVTLTTSHSLYVFRDAFSLAPWIVSNSIVVAQPRLKLFDACINEIMSNTRSGYYGASPLCPTGPNLFGRQIAHKMLLTELKCGEAIRINRSNTHSFAYLDASGDVVAVNVKRGTGLHSLGAKHNEDYNDLYNQKAIYASRRRRCIEWSALEMENKGWIKEKKVDGKFASGLVCCGPYISLVSGHYSALITFSVNNPAKSLSYSTDVCVAYGTAIIPSHQVNLFQSSRENVALQVDFFLECSVTNLEVRFYINEEADIKIDKLAITSQTMKQNAK